jgi:superfamily II RNA helicase
MSEIGSVIGNDETTYAEIIELLRKEIDYIDEKLIERQFNTEVVQFLLEQKESVLNRIDAIQRGEVSNIGSAYDSDNYSPYTYSFAEVDSDEQIKKLQAEVELLKDMLSDEKDENLEQYLSDRERGLLKKMNNMSNKITEQSTFVKDIMNKPVMEIVNNWSATHQDILRDTADLFTKSNVIENVQKEDKWWIPIGQFFKEFVKIITSGERMFYVGLTIVFIGLIFVFVNVTGD